MNDIIAIVGFICSLVSLAGVVYAVAFRLGKVDKQLSDLSQANISERIVRMETKMEVLWTVFAEQVLTNRPGLATKSSTFKLTADAVKAVEEVKGLLLDYNPDHAGANISSEEILIELPSRIGLENLRVIAYNHRMTLGELLAIVSIELGIDI